ncbi:MAG: hypothetical protein ACQEWT_00410 [Bacillota bacterium]
MMRKFANASSTVYTDTVLIANNRYSYTGKAISVSGKPILVSKVLTVTTTEDVTEPREYKVFEYGSSRIKWDAVRLLRSYSITDRLDVRASADIFLP